MGTRRYVGLVSLGPIMCIRYCIFGLRLIWSGISARCFNFFIAPDGIFNNLNFKTMKPSKKQKEIWLKQIEVCLSQKYDTVKSKHHIRHEYEQAKKKIANNEEYILKRAQWGGKWGNYYHLIALNSKNEYQFTAGFNPHKRLD
jgi:hypothetical protein